MKSLRLNLSILFSILFVAVAVGQKGIIKGTVTEADDPSIGVAFANVIVKGTSVGATTDFDGLYTIEVEPGVYTVEFSFIGYETETKEGIIVVEDQEAILDVSMGVSSITLGDVVLVGEKTRGTEASILLDQQESTDLKTVITTATLTKSGISNIGDGVSKMTGISTVESKFVFVRGMGDRYNNATLNGLPLPSPNPDTKIPRLDIFPTSIASNLSVVKAFSPSLYGDFSGGNINIDTKTAEGKNGFNISLGTSMNTQTTFKAFNTYEGSSTDAFGFDNGDRDLPSNIGSFSSNNVASSFVHGLNPELKSAAPLNGSISLSYLYSKRLKNEESKIGLASALKYGNSYAFQDGQLKQINRQDVAQIDYATKTYSFNTNTSALLGFTYDKNSSNRYRANIVYANISSDVVRELEGSNFDYQANVAARRYTFRQNNMIIGQLLGDHKFKDNNRLKLDWGASYSIAQSDEPDRKQLVFLKTGTDSYKLNKIDVNENHRFFSELDETEIGTKLNANYVIKYANDSTTALSEVNVGFNFRNKTRDFDYRQFNYRFSSNISDIDYLNPEGVINDVAVSNGDVDLIERGDPASEQKSSLMVAAGYGNYMNQLTDRFQVNVGARVEKSIQDTKYKDASTGINRISELDELYILPAVNFRFDKSSETVLRMSLSKTVSRPGFREMATFEYTEDFAGDKTRGNPNLVNGENLNLDLKMEYFPSAGQLFAVSAFGKMLDKPIEKTALASASGRLISFENAKEATVAGVEVEYVGNLKTIFGNEYLEKFDVGFNAAYIYTQVTSAEANGGISKIFTNNKRQLQGASPYLVNMNLSYNFDNSRANDLDEGKTIKKSSITLAYNIYGKRLFAAGTQGIGDAFEQPVGTLNLTYSQDISEKLKLRFSARNLLDPTIEIVQENELKDHVINSYKRGVNFGISLNYKLM